jgi:diguanylate cyclase (GGDEF)-like protein
MTDSTNNDNKAPAGLRASVAMDMLQREWDTAVRAGLLLSCIAVEIERLQLVNEAHGREAGEAVVREVASRLRACCGPRDRLCSTGDGSFLVICGDSAPDDALKMAAAMEARVASGLFACPEGVFDLKIVCGVATASRDAGDPAGLFRAAQRHLQAARSLRVWQQAQSAEGENGDDA